MYNIYILSNIAFKNIIEIKEIGRGVRKDLLSISHLKRLLVDSLLTVAYSAEAGSTHNSYSTQ